MLQELSRGVSSLLVGSAARYHYCAPALRNAWRIDVSFALELTLRCELGLPLARQRSGGPLYFKRALNFLPCVAQIVAYPPERKGRE